MARSKKDSTDNTKYKNYRGRTKPTFKKSWNTGFHNSRYNYYGRVNNLQSSWKYSYTNARQRARRRETGRREKRSSPFKGSEEYTMKKIEETSAMIKRQLMNPEWKTAPSGSGTKNNNKHPNQQQAGEDLQKMKKTTMKNKKSEYNIKEIHNQIVGHITNLSHRRKLNLISSTSSGYDAAIQQIQKQKRLELSKALRDMCSNNSVENSDYINSIIPDIGIRLENLPIEVIKELSSTLDLDFECETGTDLQNDLMDEIDFESLVNSTEQTNENLSEVNGVKLNTTENSNGDVVELNNSINTNEDECCNNEVVEGNVIALNNSICTNEEESHNTVKVKEEILEESKDIDIHDEPQSTNVFSEINNLYDQNFIKDENDQYTVDVFPKSEDVADLNIEPVSSVATQTDPSLIHLEGGFYLPKPKSLNEAISSMVKIDEEIGRLTALRQSFFFDLNNEKSHLPNEEWVVEMSYDETAQDVDISKNQRIDNVFNPSTTNNTGNDDCFYRETLKFDIAEKILIIKIIEGTLVAAAESGNMYFIDLKIGSTQRKFQVSSSSLTTFISYKFDRNVHLFIGTHEFNIKQYDFETFQLQNTIPLNSVVSSMDSCWNYIFIGCNNGSLLRYSLKKSRMEFYEKVSANQILVLKATQEGARRVLLVGSRSAPVCVRDAMSGLHMRTMDNLVSPTVYSLVLENSLVYCGTTFHDILVFSFHDGQLMHKHNASNSKGISCLQIMNKLLFASCYNGNIYVYDIVTQKYVGEIKGPGGVILSMVIFGNLVILGTMSFKFVSIRIPEYIFNYNK